MNVLNMNKFIDKLVSTKNGYEIRLESTFMSIK